MIGGKIPLLKLVCWQRRLEFKVISVEIMSQFTRNLNPYADTFTKGEFDSQWQQLITRSWRDAFRIQPHTCSFNDRVNVRLVCVNIDLCKMLEDPVSRPQFFVQILYEVSIKYF